MRKNKKRFKLTTSQLLILLVIVCVGTMLATFSTDRFTGPVRDIAGYVVTPFQNGINAIGSYLSERASVFANAGRLSAENEALKKQIEDLTERNNRLVQAQSELSRLEELYKLDQTYAEYTKIGAQVISKDPGNWYSTFVINRGSSDGVAVDMNVISGGGLVGIVTSVGKHWAQVRSIIDDESNISAMVASTSDNCVVSGNLARMNTGKIDFSGLRDRNNVLTEGTSIVTSNISSKYLTGLLIGYAADIESDANNLTKSGTIIPAADFKNIREVLVIKEIKQTKENS